MAQWGHISEKNVQIGQYIGMNSAFERQNCLTNLPNNDFLKDFG
jgi:hypothetical protein